jgi:ABC transporter substrate binding protein/Tripartite tricarboxylate transporter family receptor
LGLLASLNRPGANVTGVANLNGELAPKRLQLLRQVTPNATRFGVLVDPAFPATPSIIMDLQAAARTLALQLVVVNARTDSDLEMAFATFSQRHVGAVLVGGSAFFPRRTEQLAALATRRAVPAIFPFRESALAGGLMSYGSSVGYFYHQAGIYTGRILKGDKPADLVVVHPSVPVGTVPELIAYAKANPGKINYAAAGEPSPSIDRRGILDRSASGETQPPTQSPEHILYALCSQLPKTGVDSPVTAVARPSPNACSIFAAYTNQLRAGAVAWGAERPTALPHNPVTSIVLCQQEGGADAL